MVLSDDAYVGKKPMKGRTDTLKNVPRTRTVGYCDLTACDLSMYTT